MLTYLWGDRQRSSEAVDGFVILSAQVKENTQTTLQLGVHKVGVRGCRTQEQGLHLCEQTPEEGRTNRGCGDVDHRDFMFCDTVTILKNTVSIFN